MMTSTTSNSSQRIFSSAENALVKTSILHQGFMRVGEVLRLQGPCINLEELQTAVGCLQRRHPFLRSRLRTNPSARNTYLLEEDPTLQLKIREIPRKRDQHVQFWKHEWREREKDSAVIGEGLMEFWLLQDPDDREDDQAPREIMIICEHSICDGISLSTVAHELLLALTEEDKSLFDQSLGWPIAMETAIEQNLSRWKRIKAFSKFTSSALYWYVTAGRRITHIPYGKIDFPLNDMAMHTHTEMFSDSLSREETTKLFDKCHQHKVTVNSAISSAILRAASAFVDNKNANLVFAIPTDVRRRYQSPMANHDLSYQISGVTAFAVPANVAARTSSQDMWNLAKIFGEHVINSINAGHTFAIGMIIGKFYDKNTGPIDTSGTPTCGLSNWGLLSFKSEYGQWKLNGMTAFGNLIRLSTPMAFAYTVNGVLSIGQGGPVPLFSSDILENLQANTMEHLRQMIVD